MSGDKSGIQRVLQKELGKEIPYVHCKNHRLHLVVKGLISNIATLNQFFDEISLLYRFFTKFKVDQHYCGKALKRVLDTRWSGHYDSTVAVVENYPLILEALEEICGNQPTSMRFDAETKATAIGLFKIINSEQFQFNAVVMKRVLGAIKPADASLQKRETDINESIKVIDAAVVVLKSLRSDGAYREMMEAMKNLSGTSEDVTESFHAKRRRQTSRNLDDYIINENLEQTLPRSSGINADDERKAIFFEILDRILQEFKLRFTTNSWLYSSVTAMSRDSPNFLCREILLPLSTHLSLDIPTSAELEVAKVYLANNLPISVGQEQESNLVLAQLYEQKDAFPKVFKLAANIATFGSSTAVCESGFSVLTRIDSPYRRSMLQPRQANLTVLTFEQSVTKTLDLDLFVRRFASKHPRLQLAPM